MLNAARMGDKHDCPKDSPCDHGTGEIIEGSPNVIINGQPAARVGDSIKCQDGSVHPIEDNGACLLINGKPAARLKAPSAHGGLVITGSGNVYIGDGAIKIKFGNKGKITLGNKGKIFIGITPEQAGAIKAEEQQQRAPAVQRAMERERRLPIEIDNLHDIAEYRGICDLEQQLGIQETSGSLYLRSKRIFDQLPEDAPQHYRFSRISQVERDLRIYAAADNAYNNPLHHLKPGQIKLKGQDLFEKTGLTEDDLQSVKSGYQAIVIYDPELDSYIVANKGTSSLLDGKTDYLQILGNEDGQYVDAANVANKIMSKAQKPVIFTGHSLGGGLATVQAAVTGKEAVTFNAAGVHEDTFRMVGASDENVKNLDHTMIAYHVDGEILTKLQDSGVLGKNSPTTLNLFSSLVKNERELYFSFTKEHYNPHYGLAYLPKAQGARVTMPAYNPDGSVMSGYEQFKNSLSLHARDSIEDSMKGYVKQLYKGL